MSSDEELLATRIGRSSTYRCQVGLHEFNSEGRCPYCGDEAPPIKEISADDEEIIQEPEQDPLK